jgi:pyroglutamyl-peptidase
LISIFRHEEKNASWEAVKILPDTITISDVIYRLMKLKVNVEYENVDERVEEIWKQNPELCFHVGVNSMIDKIHLEKCAKNGFNSMDYAKKTLCNPIVCLENSGKCEVLETKINVDKITKHLNDNYKPMFDASCDVGSYLCGYIYLKSLDKCSMRTLFIHVPQIDQPYSTQETSDAILKVIEQAILTPKLK